MREEEECDCVVRDHVRGRERVAIFELEGKIDFGTGPNITYRGICMIEEERSFVNREI